MTAPEATPSRAPAGETVTEVDVAVIGGSFAGLSAALMLARGRRRVAVFDTAEGRNRFAAHSHGVFGHDGRAPAEIRADGRRDLAAYPTARLIDRAVTGVTGQRDGFDLTDAGGGTTRARRVILAYGMRDLLPDLPGLAECWGRSAVHCPYCHGYELADLPTAVLMTRPGLPHQALMLGDWTGAGLTVLTAGQDLSADDRAVLQAQGVAIDDRRPRALRHRDGQLEAVELEGDLLACGALYLAPEARPASDIATHLGCDRAEGMGGPMVVVDDFGATSVPGVFAAGDLARPVPSAPLAAAQGVLAGTGCHRSLMPAFA